MTKYKLANVDCTTQPWDALEERCKRLAAQRDKLLTACKRAITIMSQKPDEYGPYIQGGIDVLVAAIAAVKGNDANSTAET